LHQLSIKWNWLTNLRNAVLDVDIANVQHA
jgi:hypothetical protein